MRFVQAKKAEKHPDFFLRKKGQAEDASAPYRLS